MRRSLIITLLLLALAVATVGYAHSSLDINKDRVTLAAELLYGDKYQADGLGVDLRIHCDYRLFWDTGYRFGKTPQIETEFTFSAAQQQPPMSYPYQLIRIETRFGGGYSSSGTINLDEQLLPFQDVADRTQPHETHTETVYINDYYDFYPLEVDLEHSLGFSINQGTRQIFEDYFQIPVDPRHRVQIEITKNAAGEVRGSGMSSLAEYVVIQTLDTETDTHCFFALFGYDTEGKPLDYSHIPGGYGIYRFPLHNESEKTHILAPSELQTVFSLEAERQPVVGLATSTDKSRLLLVTIEADNYMLTVLAAVTLQQQQQLTLLPTAGNSPLEQSRLIRLYVYSDFIVFVGSDGAFMLLALNRDGGYEVRFQMDLGDQKELKYIFYNPIVEMAYDGEKLAIVASQNGYYSNVRRNCGFQLAIYNETGLLYAGEYLHSLDRGPAPNQYNFICFLNSENPLRVSWND